MSNIGSITISGAVTENLWDAIRINDDVYVLTTVTTGGDAGISRQYTLAAVAWATSREDFRLNYPGDHAILRKEHL